MSQFVKPNICQSQCHEKAVVEFPTIDTINLLKIVYKERNPNIDKSIQQAFFDSNYLRKRKDRSQYICSACIMLVKRESTDLESSPEGSTSSNSSDQTCES
jgi:hypothetical protein